MFRRIAAATCAALMLAGAALAEQPKAPVGEVILEISGQLEAGEAVQLDMDMLRSLPETEFETSTIWTEGVQRFTGVSLSDLLAHVGVEGGTLRAIAINDYAVEIPVSDAEAGGPIIAYLHNGREMSVRNKGPLWIVYPFDGDARYKTEEYYARSIWQLAAIEVINGS
ncbi:molybdopterin-dependent oxidoreductase [Thalassococcus sp. S3]|uniref:molybdopterin-dependent oxidoreductase n=1 Tax=Thalassococcus sp. S3 TaxID=2017482 RepID=UPI0010246D21|nr:molybdopterin-dependent oxidoreductase [Thalassococcus sp. S3]QBF30833.1 oxidoreductase [Thalassococcus sp. S3]